MKTQLWTSLAVAVALLLLCGPLLAHHGNAAYDQKNPITVKGTVTEFIWANPHVQLSFDVKDDKVGVVHWTVETLSPGMMIRAGWARDMVKPGDGVTVTLAPAKNGAPVGFLTKLILENGKEFGRGEQ